MRRSIERQSLSLLQNDSMLSFVIKRCFRAVDINYISQTYTQELSGQQLHESIMLIKKKESFRAIENFVQEV